MDAVGQPTEIDNASHTCARSRTAEVGGRTPVQFREVRSGGHRMHKVAGGMHPGNRAVERCLVEAVAANDFGGRAPWRNTLRTPCETSDAAAAFFKTWKKTAADIAGCARE